MIVFLKSREELLNHIYNDIEEMKNIKKLYENKLKVFEIYSSKLNLIEKDREVSYSELLNKVKDNINYFKQQLNKTQEEINILSIIKSSLDQIEDDILQEKINSYNEEYNILKKELFEHLIADEQITLEYIQMEESYENINENEEVKLEENANIENTIEDNNTLLISEIQNKVLLPYKAIEIKEILSSDDNDYKDIQTIINEKYTVPLVNYKHAAISRYRETFSLMRDKEKASLADSLDLALELMRNSYVHPAIITACKDSDQLDIYLDCLDTNELDDFPFFDIKYELYLMKVKAKDFDFNDIDSPKGIFGFFKKFTSKSLRDTK